MELFLHSKICVRALNFCDEFVNKNHVEYQKGCKGKGKGKGKSVPLQAWSGPEFSRKLMTLDF
jgi:hypothetical protein